MWSNHVYGLGNLSHVNTLICMFTKILPRVCVIRDDTYATSVLISYLKTCDNPVNCMHTQQCYMHASLCNKQPITSLVTCKISVEVIKNKQHS